MKYHSITLVSGGVKTCFGVTVKPKLKAQIIEGVKAEYLHGCVLEKANLYSAFLIDGEAYNCALQAAKEALLDAPIGSFIEIRWVVETNEDKK